MLNSSGRRVLRDAPWLKPGPAARVLEMLNGNHGVWLFIFENGKLLFEQAGHKNDEAAEAWGRQ